MLKEQALNYRKGLGKYEWLSMVKNQAKYLITLFWTNNLLNSFPSTV